MANARRVLWAHVLLIAVVLVWGSTFSLVKNALRDISPLLFNFLRMAIAFPILAVVYRKHLRTINRRTLTQGALVGFCLGVGYQFQTAGLRLTTASKSAFITGLAVVLVPLFLAVPALRSNNGRAPGLSAVISAAAAMAGLALLAVPAGISWASLIPSLNLGDVMTMAAAVFFAMQIVLIAKFSDNVRFEHMSLIQIGVAALATGLSAPVFENPHVIWNAPVITALLVMAILGTAAAFAVQSFAQEILPATTVVLIMALEPVSAWAVSYLFLGESFDHRQALGAVLVIAGILATELLPKLGKLG